MTQDQLQKIIDQFNEEELREKGIVGIFQYGGGPDESFLRANKEGFEMFALQLLKAAQQTEAVLADTEKDYILFDETGWMDDEAEVKLHYFEPLAHKVKKAVPPVEKGLIGKIAPYGCGLIGIILLVAILVGIKTMIGWIF
jgi:hypothetical protein